MCFGARGANGSPCPHRRLVSERDACLESSSALVYAGLFHTCYRPIHINGFGKPCAGTTMHTILNVHRLVADCTPSCVASWQLARLHASTFAPCLLVSRRKWHLGSPAFGMFWQVSVLIGSAFGGIWQVSVPIGSAFGMIWQVPVLISAAFGMLFVVSVLIGVLPSPFCTLTPTPAERRLYDSTLRVPPQPLLGRG
jgi:hypothetical protein